MSQNRLTYDVVVVGGGHAGAEAAWAAAGLGARVAMVTMDPSRVGAMSCNPAIGGLAKGQMVREIDALGGLMGLAADATGIQFRVLNATKGPAVHGLRCQSDKYRYADAVQRLLATRSIDIIAGTVEELLVDQDGSGRRSSGVVVHPSSVAHPGASSNPAGSPCHVAGIDPEILAPDCPPPTPAFSLAGDHASRVLHPAAPIELRSGAVVLTTGTFMRGLMHTGEQKTQGGRVNEAAAVGISGMLTQLGFDLGRLKTGTPPRLDAASIDFSGLEA